MPSTRLRSALVGGAVALVTVSGALSGCSISRDEEPDAQGASPSPETSASSPTATVTVTESATPTPTPTPSPTPTTPAPTATGPEAALLTAAELPRLNDELAWTERSTGPAGTDSFGVCQKFDLNSIGATDTLQRTFAADAATAGQQVADFADAQTAVRASKVVEAWHRDCAGRVPGRRVSVAPITSVPVARGTGSWYLVRWVKGGEGHFEGLGTVLSGTRLTLVRIAHTGQDHSYPAGQDPTELAVKAAAAKLGG